MFRGTVLASYPPYSGVEGFEREEAAGTAGGGAGFHGITLSADPQSTTLSWPRLNPDKSNRKLGGLLDFTDYIYRDLTARW